ncbi:hypothetical protein Tco_1258443, partial [Tanacetum coccineum]
TVVDARFSKGTELEGSSKGSYSESITVGNSELLLLVLIYYCWFRVDVAAKD